MIIAVPMSRDHLARHFTKAKQIAFYDQDLTLIEVLDNPASAGGCAAKKGMLNLIKSKGSSIVMVDMIGERMLGKLLSAGITVSQGNSRESIETLLANCHNPTHFLTSASEGRPSLNHAKKGGCGGGCGCGGHSDDKQEARPSLLSPVERATNLSFTSFKKI